MFELRVENISKDAKGKIKPLLVLLSLITFTSSISFVSPCQLPFELQTDIHYYDIGHHEIFVAVFVLLFIFEGALIVIYLFGMELLQSLGKNWWLLELVYSGTWTFFALLSSCLFSDGISHMESFYKTHGNDECSYSGWKFGVACGIITSFALGAKTYLTFVEFKKSGNHAILGGDVSQPLIGTVQSSSTERLEEEIVSV